VPFPQAARREAGYQLDRVQHGREPDDWKPMSTVGRGVREIRIHDAAGAFRVLYVAKFDDAVYVLHCFQKKSKRGAKTPTRELDLIKSRLRMAQETVRVTLDGEAVARGERHQNERKVGVKFHGIPKTLVQSMNQRQRHNLRAISSVLVGIMAFFIAFFVALFVGGILLGPLQTDVLIPPQLAALFLISILVGLIVAVFVGIKYYRHMEKSQ
jgi:phage-related protein